MNLRITKILFVLFVFNFCLLASDHSKSTIVNLIETDIYSYFNQNYGIPQLDVEIGFRRIPNIPFSSKNFQIKVRNQKGRYIPGYQTIWLEVYDDGIFIKKYPVSFEIGVKKIVLIAKSKINRGKRIDKNLVEIVKHSVKYDLQNIVSSIDEVIDLESKRFIKPGSIITNDMVRFPPVLKRGDKVELRVNMGSLSLSTAAIVKDEGHIGEKVKVICESTGKKLEGIIESPNLVVVSNSRY